MKTLIAGPWIGEFGHELFNWQSFLRSKSKQYNEIIISSRPGHHILYQDFCTKFIPFESDANNCSAATNFGTCNSLDIFKNYKEATIIKSSRLKGEQKFISYGHKNKDFEYDVIIHARNIKFNKCSIEKDVTYKESRNWSYEKWIEVIDFLKNKKYRCCCIGKTNSAFLFNNVDNLMDISLSDLSNVFASSRLVIGPSSGPMHFASLCKCPHLVWTSKTNIERYKNLWNPFNTPSYLVINNNWNPESSEIIETINTIL